MPPLPGTGENLHRAYCDSLSCTGIGAAAGDGCADLFPRIVKEVVPADMHADYPVRLLGCVTDACTGAPYEWDVDQAEPPIGDETTFAALYSDWFLEIVWPP